jgi:hypothetical protein
MSEDWAEVNLDTQTPAWQRFDAMSREVHDIMVGAAQCRNHLRAIIESWEDSTNAEILEAVEAALHRLARVGI